MADISDDDRDAAIRTMLTEAAPNDPNAWASVGNVIINRALHDKHPSTIKDIVKAPKQFEVWSNGRAQAVSKDDPNYEAAGRVFDSLINGMPDDTNGATHFYAPKAQAALGRNPPKWAQGEPKANIGGHLFYAPEGDVKRDLGIPQEAAIQTAAASAPDDEKDFMAAFGLGDTPKAPAATVPVVAAPSDDENEFKKAFGLEKLTDEDKKTLSTAATKAADPGMAVAFGSGAASGVPIAGPAILSGIVQGAGALTGQNPGAVRESIEAAQAAHPVATTAGNIAGGVAGLAPVAAIAPGLIGGTGATLGARALTAMPGNALISGTDAAVRSGGDPLATATGAGVGAIGGALAPVVGAVGNKLGQGAANALGRLVPVGAGVSRSAGNLLSNALRADNTNAVRAVINDLGPQGMLADAGPALKGLGQGIVSKGAGTESASTLVKAIQDRHAGANDRIEQEITNMAGPANKLNPADPLKVSQNIADVRTATDNANYSAVHAQGTPVDIQNVVDTIDKRIEKSVGPEKTALNQLRKELVVKDETFDKDGDQVAPAELTDDSEKLHNVRKLLDSMINYGTPGLGVEQGAVKGNQGTLKNVRSLIDDELKTQVPGMQEADAASAALAKRQSAIEEGVNAIGGANIPHPQTFADDFAAKAPGEQIALAKGARGKIDRMFGTGTQRDLVTLNKLLQGEGGFGSQNLDTIFPGNNLGSALTRERAFADTNNKIVENSQTAQRMGAAKLLEDTQPAAHDYSNATAFGLSFQGIKKAIINPVVKMIQENPTEPRNVELAKILTTQGPRRDQLVNILERFGQRQNKLAAIGDSAGKGLEFALTRFIQGGTPQLSNRLQK